ncbi:response regulator [Hyphomicrobium sp. B1]|uniref:response regulator n=1 Tax=Hyphomicrobium sp. B1 TaxID=3075651 RepID=UPI001D37E7EF|nr:response regulator [Pseudomonadota bacterium]
MKRTPTLAIVNDERNIVTSLRMAFEAEGFRVRGYADTASALQLINDPADLALLDKTNPPLGGIELFKRIRARHRMPVIFLSAWAEELEEEFKGTALQAEGYLATPFSQRSVISCVRDILRRHPPRPAIALVSPKI